jgi:hypothetical protein
MELKGEAEPVVIGLPFALIHDAKLVLDTSTLFTEPASKKQAH